MIFIWLKCTYNLVNINTTNRFTDENRFILDSFYVVDKCTVLIIPKLTKPKEKL